MILKHLIFLETQSFTNVNAVLSLIIITVIPALWLYFREERKTYKSEYEVRIAEKNKQIEELKEDLKAERDYIKEQDKENIKMILNGNIVLEQLVKSIENIMKISSDNLNINNILKGLSEANQERLKTLLKHLKVFDNG